MEIKDSKGKIYNSCPNIDNILSLCKDQKEIIEKIQVELEVVRKINTQLREGNYSEEEIEEMKEDAQSEIWEEVGDICDIRRCDKWSLEEMMKELKEENEDLLDKINDI